MLPVMLTSPRAAARRLLPYKQQVYHTIRWDTIHFPFIFRLVNIRILMNAKKKQALPDDRACAILLSGKNETL